MIWIEMMIAHDQNSEELQNDPRNLNYDDQSRYYHYHHIDKLDQSIHSSDIVMWRKEKFAKWNKR